MSQDFSNNPFAALMGKSKLYPTAKNAAGQKHSSVSSPGGSTTAHVSEPSADDDETLFLNAVQESGGRASSTQGNSSFRLEEAQSFQAMLGKEVKPVSKKKKKQTDPLPETVVVAEVSDLSSLGAGLDNETFWRAMHEVTPLMGKGRDVAPEVQPAVPLQVSENALQDFMDGKLEFALSLTGEYLEGHVVGLDDVTMNKLRAGQYSPEAHLDLHGLNAVQAFQALLGFFRSSWYKGLRSVLLVPGRGRNSPDGFGILRDKLQDWLTQEPFKRVVLAFCTARPVDGGPGSVYVLLRKYRKKGKICWERMPTDSDLF